MEPTIKPALHLVFLKEALERIERFEIRDGGVNNSAQDRDHMRLADLSWALYRVVLLKCYNS